jgi:hypothetical protein
MRGVEVCASLENNEEKLGFDRSLSSFFSLGFLLKKKKKKKIKRVWRVTRG